MLMLALTLTLSTLHSIPPSSLRLIEIEKELSSLGTTWPTGSVVLMAVGFGGAVTFSLVGFAIGVVLSGLPGVVILAVGLASGGLFLMLGIAGVIWGAAQAGANQGRARTLEEERALLLRQADGPQFVRPQLVTLATF